MKQSQNTIFNFLSIFFASYNIWQHFLFYLQLFLFQMDILFISTTYFPFYFRNIWSHF